MYLPKDTVLTDIFYTKISNNIKHIGQSIFYHVSNNVYFNIFKVIVLGVHRNRFSQ